MHFLAPFAFAFAASIPVVVVFYLLKRKRVVKLVSSTLLWQKFLAETQASAPFQKLRKNWLLILQIILLLLAVLALTRPYFSTKAKPAQRRVVILDASASMQATDESPSRFEKARAEALKWVDSLKDNDEMVIVQAGATTEVKQSATSEKAALRRALQSCTCSDGPTRLVPALRMAESLVRDLDPKTGPEIHLFSDGAVPDLSEFENKALPLIYHRVGKDANNLGITALDVRANPEDARQRAVYTSVANFSPDSQQTDLELLFDDRLLETRPLTIPAGETSPQVFLAKQSRDGVFTVRLTAQDDLAVDNQASIVSLMPKPVKVLLVTRGNRLLEKALRAAPNVELASTTDLTDPATGFDFVVLDCVTPTVWPKGNVLAIHVVNTNWLEGVKQVDAPPIVDWKSAHPLLRYASFDNVQVVREPHGADADLGGIAGGDTRKRRSSSRASWGASASSGLASTCWRATGRCASHSLSSLPTRWNGSTRPTRAVANCWSRRATRSACRCWNRSPARKSPCPMARQERSSWTRAPMNLCSATPTRRASIGCAWGRMTRSFASICSTRRRATSSRATRCNWANTPR